jgi:hypothetical protein
MLVLVKTSRARYGVIKVKDGEVWSETERGSGACVGAALLRSNHGSRLPHQMTPDLPLACAGRLAPSTQEHAHNLRQASRFLGSAASYEEYQIQTCVVVA